MIKILRISLVSLITGICILAFFPFITIGQNLIKINTYFGLNEYSLKQADKIKIDSLIITHKIINIKIETHCDTTGNVRYNDLLSKKRASTIKDYLLTKKINVRNSDVISNGERKPVNNNSTEEERTLNRLGEITFTVETNDKIEQPDENKKEEVLSNTKDELNTGKTTFPLDFDTVNFNDIKPGATLKLTNIQFLGGSHTLLPQALPTLNLLLTYFKTYPDLEIEIHGHICCQESGDGMDFENPMMGLSKTRAKAVYDYLIQNGVDPKKLSYKGFGANRKLVEEKTMADGKLNRRVEIKIINK